MSKLLDQLLSGGLEIGNFVVKAQPKTPVRSMHLPVAQDIIDRAMLLIDDQYALMYEDIQEVLRTVDARKAMGLYVVDGGLQENDLFKAKLPSSGTKPPTMNISGQPRAKAGQAGNYQRKPMDTSRAGTRGGKWYLDDKGHVRYGEKPTHIRARELHPEEVAEHLAHFRPSPFMGTQGADVRLIDHLTTDAKTYGFTQQEADYLNAWYGSYNRTVGGYTDGLVNQFLDEFGEDMDSLAGDMSAKFSHPEITNGEKVSYQEAVVAWWRRQEFTDDETGETLDFDTQVLPHLDSIHKKFEELKKNPAVAYTMERIAQQAMEKRAETLAFKIDDTADVFKDIGDVITSEPDPIAQSQKVIAALAALNLVFIPTTGETVRAANLKGVVAPNTMYLRDGDKRTPSFLVENSELLDKMTPSQLMAVAVASNLNAVWDSDTREYVVLPGVESDGSIPAPITLSGDIPHSQVADLAFRKLAAKMRLNDVQKRLLHDQINACTVTVGEKLNDANQGRDTLFKDFVRNGTELLRDPSKGEELRARFEDGIKLRDEALAAQKNSEFTVPKSMKDGVLGAAHNKTPLPHQLLDPSDPSKGAFDLFAHQKQSINWMLAVKRGILALDAGMGKTRCVITFMEQLKQQGKAKKAILFLPPSLMNQWPNDIVEAVPHMKDKILNLSGLSLEDRKLALQSPMAKSAEYILISTGTLNSGGDKDPTEHESENDGTGGSDNEMVKLLRDLDGAMFIDEVHQGGYKSADTVRHKIAREVLGDREYAFGMSATPMPNHPIDLFNLTDMFAPGAVGTKEEWEGSLQGVQYDALTDQWQVANSQNLKELRTRIQPFVFHKLVTDSEVRADPIFSKMLPKDPIQDNVHVEIGETHPMHEFVRPGGKVDQYVQSRIDQLEEERGEPFGSRTREVLAQMLSVNFHRLCNISPRLIDPEYKGPSPKLDRVVNDVVDHFRGGGGKEDKPLVIFSSFPGKAFPLLREALAKQGIDPSLVGEIHGGKSSTERGFEQDMTNQGKRKILLVGTMSGGAGLNLQKKANRTFFLDEPWHPSAKRQALGRVWRTGQKQQTFASNYRITFPGGQSWDEKVADKVSGKQAMVSAMLMPNIDIDSLNFNADINKQVEALMGGNIKEILKKKSTKKKSKASALSIAGSLKDMLGEEFQDVNENDVDGMLDIAASFSHPYAQYHDKQKQKHLKTTAPHISGSLDEQHEREAWNRDLLINNAKSRWQIKMLKVSLAQTSGDPKALDTAQRAVDKVVRQYQEWKGQLAAEAASLRMAGDVAAAEEREKQAKRMEHAFPEAFKDTTSSTLPESKKPESKKPESKKPESKKPESKKPEKRSAMLAHDVSPFAGKKKMAEEHHFWTVINDSGAKTLKDVRAALLPHMKKFYGAAMKEHKLSADDVLDQVVDHLKKQGALAIEATNKALHAFNTKPYAAYLSHLESKLSTDDVNVLHSYANDGADLNMAIRGDKAMSSTMNNTMRQLDKLIAKHQLPHAIVVDRAVSGKNRSKHLLSLAPGDEISDTAFSSASGNRSYADKTGDSIVLRISAAAGTNAVPVPARPGKSGKMMADEEQEIIFGRNQRFKVVRRHTEQIPGKNKQRVILHVETLK